MKKTVIIFLLLASIMPTAAHASATQEKTLRDSIFSAAAAQPNDTLRSKFLRNAFQNYIGQPFAVEYLDSALALSTRKSMHQEELWTLFDYCRHYEFCADSKSMELYSQKLKEASYRYKHYSLYYTIWLAMLKARCAQGDTEYAILQAKEMKIEAARLGSENGVFISGLALAQAYEAAEKYDEAAEAYLQTLKENPEANDNAMILIHGNLADIYKKQKKYPQAISELQMKLAALQRVAEGVTLSETLKTAFLDIEISLSQIYMEMGDKEKLNLHLKRAGNYYDENTFFGAYINYHALWGGYYHLGKQWDKCFYEFDLALKACRGVDPFHENGILKMKAKALMEAGDYESAAKTYRTAVMRGDSLNADILQRHEEAHQANYKIRNALLEKETWRKRYLGTQVAAGVIILLSLIVVIIRAFFIKKQLYKSEEETRQALDMVKTADIKKERFLRTITYEIRTPLNSVVGLSEVLSLEHDLTEDEIQEYSVDIKYNASKLLALINNILDLSRLEAGMMRFNVQTCDIVQLCREAKMMVDMEMPGVMKLTFNTELEELEMEADSKWMLKMLTSLLSAPKEKQEEVHQAEYTLSKAGEHLTIVVKGSPLYHCWNDDQEQRILHDINRLYVETFKGTYQVQEKDGEKVVNITFPLG